MTRRSEQFMPGSMRFDDVVLNRQHQRTAPLARTGGGGLALTDTPTELRLAATLADTQDGRDVVL